METGKLILSSSLASISSSFITHPIDVVKVRLQNYTTPVSPISYISSIYKTEGANFLTKGINATIFRNGTFISSKMFAYNYLKNKYNSNTFHEKVLCGCTAGFVGASVGSPFDVILINMQSNPNKYPTMGSSAMTIFQKDGFLGFYKGYKFTLSRAVVVTSCQFSVFDQIKQELSNFNHFNTQQKFLMSSISSSIITSVISNPIDLCKTRTINNIQPSTIFEIIKKEGILSLWKGLEANICRQIPLNLIRFGLFEVYYNLFFKT